ncbi:MAG: aldo/keto reductase [Bacteroidetes bacterium]|jgi:1-deoxyxylulose-5-phosphate synthase|nr:aldo/keto reductase [Bacteroidota bacterium]MBT4400748.1 aldo/keto reductase [Bacteroidota bacterium]MBT4411013.1 aldo/keto reductase [Bacteroidota bacterium]MBT5426216.1 aldo/keto reductase [Bacteroidota bacterium]MBT7092004.1 aldo/keto reductase [Bacteroidota bacterium]
MLRNLGSTNIKIAPLVLGTDNFANPTPEVESIEIINRALDSGINMLDTSNSYSNGESERIIGKALKKSGRRNDCIIATKVFYPTGPGKYDQGLSGKAIIKACEDSLKRLQTDYIDLYQLHRPDYSIPQEESLKALAQLQKEGKIRHIGSSTAPTPRVLEGLMISRDKGYPEFITEQPPYNLLDRSIENELLPMCISHNLGVITWSPLAMGILAGRYTDYHTRPKDSRSVLRGGIYADRITQKGIDKGNQFIRLARQYNYNPAQMALLWVKDQQGITAPIMGPRTLDQLNDFLPVAEMTLPDEIRAACDDIVAPGTSVANFHNSM